MLDAIPFDMPGPIPFVIVEGRAGAGVPARILLDTGAAAPFPLIVSPGFAARAGARFEALPETAATGALGAAPVAFRAARLARFRLGPVALDEVAVGVSGAVDAVGRQIGREVDAVLGHHFLAGRTIAIDYARRRLELRATAGPDALAIRFTLAPGRPLTLVRVGLNGRGPFLMALDTGASTTLLSPATAAAAGIEASEAAALGGAGGAVAGGARLGRAEIRLGPLVRGNQAVAVADVLEPVRAAAGAAIEGVLGADLFLSGRITIDYGTNRLWFAEGREEG